MTPADHSNVTPAQTWQWHLFEAFQISSGEYLCFQGFLLASVPSLSASSKLMILPTLEDSSSALFDGPWLVLCKLLEACGKDDATDPASAQSFIERSRKSESSTKGVTFRSIVCCLGTQLGGLRQQKTSSKMERKQKKNDTLATKRSWNQKEHGENKTRRNKRIKNN